MADPGPGRGSESRPNVLLLLTDQERHDLTAPDGVPVETAAFDRLAAEGVRFTRAYTPISICSSARASLLTGLYPHQHGLLNNVHEADALRTDLSTSLPTFGSLLADAGYANSYLGKWHVGREATPEAFGFTHVEGGAEYDDRLEAGLRAHREELGVDLDPPVEDPVYTDHPDHPYLLGGRTSIPVEATRPYYLADRTIDRLERLAAGAESGEGEDGGDGEGGDAADRPFFHRTDFQGPHHPYVVPEPYASMYDPEDLEPWPSLAETFEGKPQVHENYLEYRGVASFEWADWAELLALYMGFVHLIDDQVGRILDALSGLGLAEETLVVHAADHGDFTGNHRQFNKGPLMYEDTYRVPLAVRGPGVSEGRECEALVSLLDLMPTFLELADAPVPAVEGQSLWPHLRGETSGGDADADADTREAVFAEYHGDELGLYSQRMVRTDRYKYVFNAPDVDELYDLEADPHELQNLIDHPEYEAVRERLRRRLVGWMAETDDPIHEWSRRHLVPGAADRDGPQSG